MSRSSLHATCGFFALLASACGTRNMANPPVARPEAVTDFSTLYAKSCSGCHGADGKGGAAIGIGDPVYLAIADNSTIARVTADGVTGTSMPAFAQSSGGTLTDKQIQAIVQGMRAHWSKPDALRGATLPPYAADVASDPKRGAVVFGTYCSSCHGVDGRGGKRASSIVDASYLALVSDQNLRTTVIVGRPDLGAPDWRGDVPGKPLSSQDVSDVVAWLSSQRPRFQQQTSIPRSQGGLR